MAGPWEKYQKPAAGPWEKYSKPQADISGAAEGTIDQPKEAGGVLANIAAAPGKLAGAADDMARIIANAATFGQADRLAGYMSGTGKDAENKLTAEARKRAGSAAIAGDVLGSLAPAGMIAGAGRAAGAVSGLGKYVAPVAGSAALGGTMGAADAALNGKDVLTNALIGTGAGVVGHGVGKAIGAGVNAIGAGAKKLVGKGPVVQTPEQIRAAKDAAYKAADDAGVIYTPEFVKRVTQEAQGKAANIGYSPRLQKGAKAVFSELKDRTGKNITMKDADILRRIASSGYKIGDKQNNSVVRSVVNTLDDAIANPRSQDVLMGNAKDAGKALVEARSLAQRDFKIQDIEAAFAKAVERAQRTGSGGNVDNAIRQEVSKVLARRQGWTPDEKEALQKIISGAPGQNLTRLAGKLSPSGNGLMAALGIGATAYNPAMAGFALGGMGAKAVSDGMTKKATRDALKIIAAGGSKKAAFGTPLLTDEQKKLLIRALVAGGAVSAPRTLTINGPGGQ